jgi:cation diffusion facilitator family transporter
MITRFVSRLLPQDPLERPKAHRRLGIISGAVGIALNALLFGGKFLMGQLTGSVSITADALNNLSDAGSSFVTLVCFRIAGQKPDASHPFGHGRVEYLSGLFVSVAILLVGVELLKSSAEKVFSPVLPEFRWLSVVILSVSICVKLCMFAFNRALSKAGGSAALLAVSKDSLSDAAATFAVLAASLLEHFTHVYLDGYFGIAVALFIVYTGIVSAKDTLDPLLGQPPDPSLVRQIEETVLQQPGISGVHDLIVHDYGPGRCMVSLHAEVSETGNIIDLHEDIDRAERALKTQLGCDAVIHMDPIVTDNREANEMRKKIAALVQLIDPSVSIHDFRMTRSSAHTKLIFEVAVPPHLCRSDKQIIASIRKVIHALDPTYEAVISVDQIPAPPS